MKKINYDLLGIGIGPFNLSLAALMPNKKIKALFLEQADQIKWHQGLMFPFSSLTVSFVKDLVTLVNPTSPYTFLSYLFEKKRIYQFISADLPRVSRQEFEHYMQWVSQKLSILKFNSEVQSINYENNRFVVSTKDQHYYANNIVLGHGALTHVPDCAKAHLGETVLHAANFLHVQPEVKNKTVTVVGGGQTASEVVLHLLTQVDHLPKEIIWISPRTILWPLDESPFSNELYTPGFDQYFYHLDESTKSKMLKELKFTGDGITTKNLQEIYKQIYDLRFIKNYPCLNIKLSHTLVAINPMNNHWELSIKDLNKQILKSQQSDFVILATGFENPYPSFLEPLRQQIDWNNGFKVNHDFSIKWAGEKNNKIFVQNAARKAHGIADPYFSLMAWRSAKIINTVSNDQIYDISPQHALIHWD